MQSGPLEAALNTMPQALCMFDAQQRLVLCNRRYSELFSLPPKLAKPGASLVDILKHGVEAGLLHLENGEAFVSNGVAIVQSDKPSKSTIEFRDGRVFCVAYAPSPGGGGVATFEDISEQTRIDRDLAQARAALIEARNEAERAAADARKAHQSLRAAFDLVPEALTLMDNEDRFVLWNRRYEELYSEPIGLRVGMTFEECLRIGLSNNQFPAANGREEEWLADRLARHATSQSQHEHELLDGRWMRVQEQRTADGGSIGIRIDITEMRRRQESFRLLFDSNPVPMWVFDSHTLRFLAVNEAAVAHYGYSRDQFLAMTILDIRTEKDGEFVRKIKEKEWTTENGSVRGHTKADGSEILVAVYARSITYEGRNGRLAAVIDVTERMRGADELSRAKAFLNLVIESIPEAILVKNVQDRRFTMVNRAAQELIGLPRNEMIGRTADETYPAEYAKLVRREDDELLRRGELFIDNHSIELHGKQPRIVTVDRKLLRDGAGQPQFMLAVIRDITERKHAEERIAHLARHDSLTDLPNRSLFNDHLAACLDRANQTGSRFAVVCIDLDRLKEVNDVFGHAAGDHLLREVSRRLLKAADGAFLARLGGDEFALVAEEREGRLEITTLTDRMIAAVEEEVHFLGARIRSGLSIGVATFPHDARDLITLLGNADAALYRAKAEGRGVTRFYRPEMDKRLRERHGLRHDLSLAIERGELAMFYQPQAEVTGEIVGFEALLRWRHPLRGSVPPSEFIPIAEESWLIVQIGEWALREVCREAATWSKRLGVAVNLSPVQFQHGDLPSLVHSILLETGLAADRLELEITEGVLIADSSRGLSVLRRLKALGVHIAMDDFGKGYSSLSYLQSFPFDKIKIDRAFVSQAPQNPQSAAIVRAVLGLARGLGLPVLAEGVETKEELAFLASEACDQVQGYLIGKPRPIEDYAEVVGRRAREPSLEATSAARRA